MLLIMNGLLLLSGEMTRALNQRVEAHRRQVSAAEHPSFLERLAACSISVGVLEDAAESYRKLLEACRRNSTTGLG